MLDKEKDKINPKMKKGVYLIPYSCGDVYIGETCCSIKTRLREHCLDINHCRKKKLAVADHSLNNNHHICIEESKVVALEEHYRRRQVREEIKIEKHLIFFNKDDSLILSESWKPIIHDLKRKALN